MKRHKWLRQSGLALTLLALAMLAGCRSTSTTRKGVTSVESASAARESILETAANSKPDPNPVVPASWTTPVSGGECSH